MILVHDLLRVVYIWVRLLAVFADRLIVVVLLFAVGIL